MTFRAIIVILTIASLTSSCDLKTADDYLFESNKLTEREKYKEAIELLDKAIEKNPKYREAYLKRGLCHEKLKDFNSAILDYKALLKVDPKNTAAFYNIGTCKYDLNYFEEAVEYYNKALATKGYSIESDTSGTPSITIDLNKNGIIEDAKFDIESNQLFYQRGLAYYQLNKFRSAYVDFYKCLTHNYYVTDCHYMIALCYFESGNKEKACTELDKAIALGDTLSKKKKQEVCN